MVKAREIKALTVSPVYYLSSHIRYLKDRRIGDFVVYENGSVEKEGTAYILGALRWLERLLETHGLAAQAEIRDLTKVIKEFETKYGPGRCRIEEADSQNLTRIVNRIEAAVLSELRKRSLIEISMEGLLYYPQLLSEGIRLLFTESATVEKLDPIVTYDLSESARCLAFGTCTASVMSSLRAVEGALRDLYTALTGQKTKLTWKPLLNKIENLLDQKKISAPELLGYLDGLKNIRNSADHPEKMFIKSEAEHALIISANAVEAIYKVIEALGQKGP